MRAAQYLRMSTEHQRYSIENEGALGGEEEDKGSVISQNHRAGGIQRGQHGGDIEPSGATGVAPRLALDYCCSCRISCCWRAEFACVRLSVKSP